MNYIILGCAGMLAIAATTTLWAACVLSSWISEQEEAQDG